MQATEEGPRLPIPMPPKTRRSLGATVPARRPSTEQGTIIGPAEERKARREMAMTVSSISDRKNRNNPIGSLPGRPGRRKRLLPAARRDHGGVHADGIEAAE